MSSEIYVVAPIRIPRHPAQINSDDPEMAKIIILISKMQWEHSLYRITVQPHLNLDLNQIGVIQQNVRMNDEKAAGVIWMATNLFGKERESHLRIEMWTGRRPVITQLNGETINVVTDLRPIYPATFPQFLRQWVPFILDRESIVEEVTGDTCDTCDPTQPVPVEAAESWSDYILKLEASLGHVINVNYMTYNCRLINRDKNWSSIYQFITRSFVDGAALCLSWFGLPIDVYLDNIYLGNIPLRREQIGSQS